MWKRKLHTATATPLLRILSRRNAVAGNILSCDLLLPMTASSCRPETQGCLFRHVLYQSRGFHFIKGNISSLANEGKFFCSESNPAYDIRCWNCNAVADTDALFLVCDSCRAIQPVNPSVNYFQIFGLEKKYDIGTGKLDGKYKDWQKRLHPDLVHSKSQRERDYASEQSSRVIDAYRTLIDPLSRAIYIMKLDGINVDEEERITDPELLAEIMELREAVEEATETKALKQIQAQIQEKLDNMAKFFGEAFLNKKYEDALEAIRRMTYYKRANEEIIKRL